MSIDDLIRSDIINIKNADWNIRKGSVVPSTSSVALSNGAVELETTYIYADLANSSRMARHFDRRVTAKILKSFLAVSARLIRNRNGKVMSFDGDRVMGAFVGTSKNTDAVKCAFAISYAVTRLIRPQFEAKYDTVKNADFRIGHATGIDTGTTFIVRAGVTKVHLTGLKHAAQKTGLVDVLREGNIVHQPFPASDGKALVKKMKASMPTKCASQLPELQ